MVFGYRQSASHARLAKALGIHAGHEAATTWTARWIGNIGHSALGPTNGERVDIWSGDAWVTKASEISVAEIVYEKYDDVGPFTARFLGEAK